MKILVVEDDSAVAQAIRDLLSTYHYAVDVAVDGIAGLELAESFGYDLMLLDIKLPRLDGISLCQQLRAKGIQTPILLLTGQGGGGHEKAIALNAGADDYINKPFDAEELIARMQALLRRGDLETQPILTWGRLEVDPSCCHARYDAQLLPLTPREYSILELLSRNPQKALSSNKILDQVWSSLECPGEATIRVHIKELRKKLKAAGAPSDFIKTVPRMGYQLNPAYGQAQVAASNRASAITVPSPKPEVASRELQAAWEQLQAMQVELDQKNQELELAYQALAQKQQQLEDTRRELGRRTAAETIGEQTRGEQTDVEANHLLQANQLLLQQQNQWRALFENTLDAIAIADDDGNYIDANPAACELFGVSKDQLLQSSVADFADPNVDIAQVWQQFLAQGHVRGEFRLYRPDGTQRETEFTAVTNFIPGRHLSVLRDISERARLSADRNQAELALREREAFLASIYEWTEQAIFVIDVTPSNDFHYVSFNPTSQKYSGVTQNDIQGKTPEAVFGLEAGALLRQNYVRCLQSGEPITYEEEIAFKAQTIWTLTTLSPLRNEQHEIYRIVGTAVDISDRKQAELALQDSRDQIQRQLVEIETIYQSAPIGLNFLDTDLRFVRINQRLAEMNGISVDEHIGRTVREVLPHLADQAEQLLRAVLETGEPLLNVEITGETPAQPGVQRIWLESFLPIRDGDRIIGINTVCEEITERKRAEHALQQQIQQEYLLADIAQEIRQSFNLNEVLSRTVERVRALLNTDRVVIFRFRPSWQGDVIMESVGTDWTPILSTTIYDPCFEERYIEPYRQGHISVITDIDSEELEPCYVELLKSFQVKANLVMPILQGEALWGLLIVHSCAAPRQWQSSEISLIQRLAIQVGIAIRQSELYEQMRQELLIRQQMQAVLEESEERFRTLSAAAPVGILQTNADGICLYANACWQQMSGLSLDDSLGNGWLQAIHPDDRQLVVQAWEQHLQYQVECQLEFRLLTPQRQTRWVVARSASLYSATGETTGNVCIFADITERKQAEQALRDSEQRLQTIIDNAPAAIYLLDLENRFLLVNRMYAEINATPSEEMLGKSIYEFWPKPIADTFAASNKTVFETGQLQQVEDVVAHPDGQQHIYISVKFPLCNAAGTPYAICGISTDITEKKRMESQFYQAQRLESLGQLASGIAHDLNNVLTPILAMAQILRLTQASLNQQGQEHLKLIEDSAQRGADMVQQILTFVGGRHGNPVSVDVVALLQEVTQMIQQSFPKSIMICPDFLTDEVANSSAIAVRVDPTHLHQVLMNLCINARDAMPDGGTLTLSIEQGFVDKAMARLNLNAKVGNYVVITVADTGIGIPAEMCDRIFDPFFTTKEMGKGTGLGLSNVLGIVKNYGGFLQVFSQVGQGTQIKVYLPTTADTPSAATSLKKRLDGNGEQILIVDDDHAVQSSIQILLDNHCYKTRVADDGLQALEIYRQHQAEISLVILDVMMPNMDGIELIKQLKALNPQVKIIAASGLPINHQPALTAGATVFLNKPYPLDTLLQHVADLVESDAPSASF
ncbi:MAG: PAS domain-containing protein [Thainema sp.]